MQRINLSPIVLFTYNRLYHTKQTIEALSKNELANESELIIYSDGAKNKEVKEKVQEVRQYLKTIQNLNAFKSVTIIEREENWGLANSIIDGVTDIVNKYGKIIVLEDDLVTSPYFLKFMNNALEYYQNQDKVWHISGWNYPIATDNLEDVFLWRVMNCWGWATWSDRWQYFEKEPKKLMKTFSKNDIKRFNLDGYYDFWSQVEQNIQDNINTWAIFWYASIFINNGLCLNPTKTLVDNIGFDDSGVHCDNNKEYKDNINIQKEFLFTNNLKENKIALNRVKAFYKTKHQYYKE
jgi:hypothetical protein